MRAEGRGSAVHANRKRSEQCSYYVPIRIRLQSSQWKGAALFGNGPFQLLPNRLISWAYPPAASTHSPPISSTTSTIPRPRWLRARL